MYSIKSIQKYLEGKGGRMGVTIPREIMERAKNLSTDGTTVPAAAIKVIMADRQIEEEFKLFAKEDVSIPEPYKAVPEKPVTLG